MKIAENTCDFSSSALASKAIGFPRQSKNTQERLQKKWA